MAVSQVATWNASPEALLAGRPWCMRLTIILLRSLSCISGNCVDFFFILDWGSSSAICPLEALQSVWLIVRFPIFLNVPALAARCLSLPQPAVDPSSHRRNYGREMVAKWCLGYATRVLLHAANLRHGTDNFTSLPKEGVLRIFYRHLKIRRLRPGLNPRTWVSEASTLPLHHRSRYKIKYM